MKKELKDKHFVKKPVYRGGIKAMQAFLHKQKKYPKRALEQKIEGTVHLRYTINNKGKVIKTKVIAGLGHGCDEEAQRIVSLLEFQVSPTHKLKVQFHKTIHIHYKLPKVTKTQTKIVYTSDSSNTKPGKQSRQGKSKSFEYQIKW